MMKNVTDEIWEFIVQEVTECKIVAKSIYNDVGNEAYIELALRLEHLLKKLEQAN